MIIQRTGVYKLDLLTDELLNAFPDWSIPDPLPEYPTNRKSLYRVRGGNQFIELEVPDSVNLSALNAVLVAHNPRIESPNEKSQRADKENRRSLQDKLKLMNFSDGEIAILLR